MHLRPLPAGAPRDRTVTPQCSVVLQAIVKNNMQVVRILRLPTFIPTLHDQFFIGKLLQSDQPPPYTQGQAEGPYSFKAPDQWGRNLWGGGATRKPRTYSKSYFNQTNRHSTPLSQPAIREGHTHRPAPAAPLQPKRPPRPLPPKAPHQWTSGAVIYFQTSPNQHKFKAMTNNFPLIMTVTSR